MTRVLRILFLIALPLAVYSSGSAAALHGKVSDVFDGESIAILSQTHTLKVKLLGVAAPEKDQAYSSIARQHLADLVLNKFVVVKYSALRDGYLVGQVMFGEMDVCGQMIRDGVAWYKRNEGDVSQLDRQIYEASQTAARVERRGLWQDGSPVAPWDFHKAQLAKLNVPAPTTTATVARAPLPAPARKVRRAGLTSEDLVGGAMEPGATIGRPEVRQLSAAGAPLEWLKYQPADRHFSILVPSDGVEMKYQVLGPQATIKEVNYVVGAMDRTLYLVIWGNAPNGNLTDASAATEALNGMLSGINRARGEQTGNIQVTATPGRALKLDGYTGRQYALTAGPLTGVIRVLSKQIGEEREVFILCVLNGPDAEESGARFLTSFRIRNGEQETVGSVQ